MNAFMQQYSGKSKSRFVFVKHNIHVINYNFIIYRKSVIIFQVVKGQEKSIYKMYKTI